MPKKTVVAEVLPPAEKYPTGWKPGQSGNPAGRPPLGDSVAEIVREALEEIPAKEVELAEKENREPRSYKRLLVELYRAKALSGDLQAFQYLVTRGWGAPAKHVKVEGQVEHGGMVEHRAGRELVEERINDLASRKGLFSGR